MPVNLSTPKGEISIRQAVPSDAPDLLALRLEGLSVNPEAFAADVEKTTADGPQAWVERLNQYAAGDSGAILVATAGTKLIGMNGVVRGHWPKTRHSGSLWGVYVTPGWRGLHVGQAIVNGCVDWAVQHELTVLTLGVIISNVPAIRCYARCGFTVFGIQPRITFYHGVYYDDLLMSRLL
jgi:RimJ/RimL family protein N-acetyltransferase